MKKLSDFFWSIHDEYGSCGLNIFMLFLTFIICIFLSLFMVFLESII